MQDKSHIDGPTRMSIALFILSVVWFRRKKNSSSQEEEFNESKYTVSSRGASVLQTGSSYWASFILCVKNPCDPSTNPEGYIALCTAENKLVQEALASRLMRQGTAITAFSDSSSYCHASSLGLYNAREAVAYFLQKRFLRKDLSMGMHRVDDSLTTPLNSLLNDDRTQFDPQSNTEKHIINPDHIAFGAGVNSLISEVLYSIASTGDVVLIPAPYYAAFDYDVKTIARCEPRPVYMNNPIMGPTIADLENAAQIAEKQGKRVRVLLLTNPNDPLGVIYTPHVMRGAVEWASKRKLHIIVDEIFALSVRKTSNRPEPFESIIRLLDNRLGNNVHFLWGLSKDFGATGFRFGVIYTQNVQLLQTLANLNIFAGVPNPMQMIISEFLVDDQFVDLFLEQSQLHLISSYNICTQKLEEMVIPFVPAEAGLFVYVDFSSLLPEQTFEGEAKFASLIESVARVVMTPGQSQKDCKPGMFRLCYTWVTPEVLAIAMERLSYIVMQIRRTRCWEDLLLGSWTEEVTKCGTHLSSKRSTPNLSGLVL